MELSLPDMPFGMGGRRARRPRTQASLAVSADGENWILINASPDLEGENPETASETAANVGVEISARNARLVYIPGAAAVTAAMMERIKRADVVFFDGTLFRDDEISRAEPVPRLAAAWGTCPFTGRMVPLPYSRALPGDASTCTSTIRI